MDNLKQEYDKYKGTLYYNLKTNCGKTIKSTSHLKEEMRGRLENAIRKMYASEKEFINSRGKKTFDDIWDKAIDKKNTILEDIINEYKALER